MRTDIRRARDLQPGDRVLSYDYEQEAWTVDAVITGVHSRTARAVMCAIVPRPARTVPGQYVRWYTWDPDTLLTIEYRGGRPGEEPWIGDYLVETREEETDGQRITL